MVVNSTQISIEIGGQEYQTTQNKPKGKRYKTDKKGCNMDDLNSPVGSKKRSETSPGHQYPKSVVKLVKNGLVAQ